MGATTKIAWSDSTWNPVRGCSRVSTGCERCYAEGVAARFSAPGLAYAGLARQSDHGPRWTGKVVMAPDHLDDPIRWKRPRRIFVNSMSDLFHEKLTDEEIERVFLVMLAAPRHTYQVLTKRAERMRRWVNAFCEARGMDVLPPFIWLGVSAEDQANADARIPELLATPAAVRFVSAEPLLGPIDLRTIPANYEGAEGDMLDALSGCEWRDDDPPYARREGKLVYFARPDDPVRDGPGIDWVIVGGESGRRARPFDIEWARSIRDQCAAAGTACFIKQLGDASVWPLEEAARAAFRSGRIELSRGGGDPAEWPEDLRVREFPPAPRQLANAPP